MICSRLHCRRSQSGFGSSFSESNAYNLSSELLQFCSLTSEQAPCLQRGGHANSSCFPFRSPSSTLHARGTAQMRWLAGEMVMPILDFRVSFSLWGGLKVNFCKREVKKINSSVLASCSPRHARFPERQEYKTSYLPSWCRCPALIEIFYHVFKI